MKNEKSHLHRLSDTLVRGGRETDEADWDCRLGEETADCALAVSGEGGDSGGGPVAPGQGSDLRSEGLRAKKEEISS